MKKGHKGNKARFFCSFLNAQDTGLMYDFFFLFFLHQELTWNDPFLSFWCATTHGLKFLKQCKYSHIHWPTSYSTKLTEKNLKWIVIPQILPDKNKYFSSPMTFGIPHQADFPFQLCHPRLLSSSPSKNLNILRTDNYRFQKGSLPFSIIWRNWISALMNASWLKQRTSSPWGKIAEQPYYCRYPNNTSLLQSI